MLNIIVAHYTLTLYYNLLLININLDDIMYIITLLSAHGQRRI